MSTMYMLDNELELQTEHVSAMIEILEDLRDTHHELDFLMPDQDQNGWSLPERIRSLADEHRRLQAENEALQGELEDLRWSINQLNEDKDE